MKQYYVYDDNDNFLGTIETTCLKYAERIAKEEYANYSYLKFEP